MLCVQPVGMTPTLMQSNERRVTYQISEHLSEHWTEGLGKLSFLNVLSTGVADDSKPSEADQFDIELTIYLNENVFCGVRSLYVFSSRSGFRSGGGV